MWRLFIHVCAVGAIRLTSQRDGVRFDCSKIKAKCGEFTSKRCPKECSKFVGVGELTDDQRQRTYARFRKAASGDYADDGIHKWVSQYLRENDHTEWNRILEKIAFSKSVMLRMPYRGEVFLDKGWTPINEKDFKWITSHLRRGEMEFGMKARRQHYTIRMQSFDAGTQRNNDSGIIRNLRFFFNETVSGDKEEDSAKGHMYSDLKRDDLVRALSQEAPEFASSEQVCADGGIARTGFHFQRSDDPSFRAYFACHDDQGSGLDLCFFVETSEWAQLCRSTYHNLKSYRVSDNGEVNIPLVQDYGKKGKSIVQATLIDNGASFKDDLFWLAAESEGQTTTTKWLLVKTKESDPDS